VDLPAGIFVCYLAERLLKDDVDVPLEEVLKRLVLTDLYLACAYLHEVSGAEGLVHHYVEKLPALLSSRKLSATKIDEFCQQLRIQLLMRTTEAGPGLAGYSGRGTLISWMRVIVARMANNKRNSLVRETHTENAPGGLETIPMTGADAELELIKRSYFPEFRQALREAFATLSSEQRLLLRLHFFKRMSTTRMGPLFGKDQSTISRKIKTARHAVYDETKRRLQERLGLSTQEFESLLKVIESQFDSSLAEDLKDEEKKEGEDKQSQQEGEEEK
jgi:RNA polymerase sigma-70 factor